MATKKKKDKNELVIYLDSTGLLLYNDNGCQTALSFVVCVDNRWRDINGIEIDKLRHYSRNRRTAIDDNVAVNHNDMLEAAQLAALDLCSVKQSVAPFKFKAERLVTYLGAVVAAYDQINCVNPDSAEGNKRYLFIRDNKTFAFFSDNNPDSLVEVKRIA